MARRKVLLRSMAGSVLTLAASAAALVLTADAAVAAEWAADAADGSTIVIRGDKVRLRNLTAPPLDQPAGLKARDHLQRLIQDKKVTCTRYVYVKYKLYADCQVEGLNLTDAMAESGLAKSSRD